MLLAIDPLDMVEVDLKLVVIHVFCCCNRTTGHGKFNLKQVVIHVFCSCKVQYGHGRSGPETSCNSCVLLLQ